MLILREAKKDEGHSLGRYGAVNDHHGVPKEMRQVLRERHVDVSGMTADQMRATLAAMDDFNPAPFNRERAYSSLPA
jgi:hypothetical protein